MTQVSKPERTFTAGHGGSRLGSYISIFRYSRGQHDRVAHSTVQKVSAITEETRHQDNPRILDLGCGSRPGIVLALHTLGLEVTGVDYDFIAPRPSFSNWRAIAARNGIERAAKTIGRQLLFDRKFYRSLEDELGQPLRWDGLDTRTMDARNLDFDNETFSFIFSAWVFEHISDVDAAARELHRVMRAGGKARIMTHLFPSLSGGHVLAWAVPGVSQEDTPVPPWDHLRKNDYPAHVYLNKLRAADYMEIFRRYFEIDCEEYETEGEEILTPEIRAELAHWPEKDLLRRIQTVTLRKV